MLTCTKFSVPSLQVEVRSNLACSKSRIIHRILRNDFLDLCWFIKVPPIFDICLETRVISTHVKNSAAFYKLAFELEYLPNEAKNKKSETQFFRPTYLKFQNSLIAILQIIHRDLELAALDHSTIAENLAHVNILPKQRLFQIYV